MQALKFTLSGKTAFFRRPEVNTYYYFNFGNIHKVALLGIFGAILGYQGYNNTIELPEFYQKLKDMGDLDLLYFLIEDLVSPFEKAIEFHNANLVFFNEVCQCFLDGLGSLEK